jgi:hypothetical protein
MAVELFSSAVTAPTTIAAFRRRLHWPAEGVYAAADVTKQGGYYAINVAPLRLLQDMMGGPDAAGRNQDTVE